MDRGRSSILREFCPKLLCYWTEEKALEFVKRCYNMNEIEICWLWDWFLLQIKNNDTPLSKIYLIIASFLLKKLPTSHKLPNFTPLKLITVQDDSNIIQVSNIVTEIANRNQSTSPSLLVKPLIDLLMLENINSDHIQLIASLSHLLLKSLHKHNPKSSYKAIESILTCDIEILQRFFLVDNFINVILFTVSSPFHKGMSTFYSTEIYLKCLNTSKEMKVISVENYNHSIFYHLIHWSEYLSLKNISYLFNKIHDHYLNSFEISDERDMLCFSTFIISLFCRNINSQSIDFFDSLYSITSKSIESGLFSIIPLDNEPIHTIKSIKLPYKLFNLLLEIAKNNNAIVSKGIWKNIKFLFEINLHQIDLKHFISLLSKCFSITEEEFNKNAINSLNYIFDSHLDDIIPCDDIYLETLTNLVSSLYKLGDLHTFFDVLKGINFDFALSPCILRIIQHSANEFTDNSKLFESLIQLMDRNSNNSKLTITARIIISSLLFSIKIKDNLQCRTFIDSLSKYINNLDLQGLSMGINDLNNTSLYFLILSLFITIRKIESCFTYTINYSPYKQVNDLTKILFSIEKFVNLNSNFASYQLKLCGSSLVHTSLYYATRMFNNEDLWAIDNVTNLSTTIYKLSLNLSHNDIKIFYLLYISNPHLLEIYGIALPNNINILSQILNEYPNMQFNPNVIASLINEEDLCELLDSISLNNSKVPELSKILSYFDNPTPIILNKTIKCLSNADNDSLKEILSRVIEILSDKKSLQQTFASHVFNELVYPLDKQVCIDCQNKCKELDKIKISIKDIELSLFKHINIELICKLIEKSLKYILLLYSNENHISDDFMVFLIYNMLKHLCKFELPIHVTNCTYCGLYIKRKDIFLHFISLDLNYAIFKNFLKYKKLNKYISLLVQGSMKLENNIIAIKNFMNPNLSREHIDVCVAFIGLISMDKSRQINQQLSLELLLKSNELNLSIQNILLLGSIVGSVDVLNEYLKLLKNNILDYENQIYLIIKNVIQNDHIKMSEDILNSINTSFLSNNRVNIILKLFVCDSILKASRGVFNPSLKTKGELYNMITIVFKNSIEYVIKTKDAEIYIYLCKITCSLYYRMKKSSLNTLGYINVNNHLILCDILIKLSTLSNKINNYNSNLLAKHSFMCIYSLLNYGSGASQPQILRLLNIWINKIPDIIISCKNIIEISGFEGVKLLLDIIKLMRNKKIINSTKRYIPLLLTLILKQIRMVNVDDNLIMFSIKRQIQLSLEACGPKIVQEWSYDMPNNLRIYLKQLDIKLSSYNKYKNL